MRPALCIVMMTFCLAGCSEMRVIGTAAIRELRADSVAVNWGKAGTGESGMAKPKPVLLAAANIETVSAVRSSPKLKKTRTKGLWEQQGR